MRSILEVGGEERFDFGGVDGFGAKDRITLLRITCEGKRNESGDDDFFLHAQLQPQPPLVFSPPGKVAPSRMLSK